MALGVFHEVFVDVVSVELEHAVHVFLGLLRVFSEKGEGLHVSDFLEVFIFQNSSSVLG